MSFCAYFCLFWAFLFASSSDCARGFAFTGLLHQSPVSSGYLLVPVLIAGASVSLKVRSSALSSQSFGELLQGKGFSIPSSQLLLRWAMDLKPWVQIFSFSPFASSYCKLKITFMGSSVAFWLSYSNPESKIDPQIWEKWGPFFRFEGQKWAQIHDLNSKTTLLLSYLPSSMR